MEECELREIPKRYQEFCIAFGALTQTFINELITNFKENMRELSIPQKHRLCRRLRRIAGKKIQEELGLPIECGLCKRGVIRTRSISPMEEDKDKENSPNN